MPITEAECYDCGEQIDKDIIRTKNGVVCVDCYNSRYDHMTNE